MKIKKKRINKLRASIANIALFLSIFVVLFPLTLQSVSASGSPTTWYVDDIPGTGPGNPPENFTSIQEAIDNESVTTGDIIYVYSGVYEETVEVDKTINLTGEDRDTTIIDADHTGTVITISASWVNVTGFKIKNGGLLYGYGIWLKSDNNKIWECNISENSKHGIQSHSLQFS